jgi:hypothetical protein
MTVFDQPWPCISNTYLRRKVSGLPARNPHAQRSDSCRDCTCVGQYPGAIFEFQTLAVSARVMPVTASPSPRSGRPSRPHLQRAGSLRAGDPICKCQRRRAIGNVKPTAPTDLAGQPLRQQIASSLRAPAGSDDARNAPADKDLRSLAQMTTPRDGLPAPLLHGPRNAVRSPTCPGKPRQPRAPAAHQRALDNSSTRCHRFQQDAPSVPITGAAVATSNGGLTAHFGSGVPSPLWFPLRFGARDGQKHLPDMHHTKEAENFCGGNCKDQGESRRQAIDGKTDLRAQEAMARCLRPGAADGASPPSANLAFLACYAARGCRAMTSAPCRSWSR